MGGMAKDKFLLVSLKDDEAKKLAQVITNDTSRKILDFLSESEATETQIAQALGAPLPTVHYNLKALEGAKLVVCEQFHYSSKGREVNHYKLANKYIIIAPQSTYGIKEKLKSLLPVVPVIGGGALALEWYASMQSKATSFSAAPMEALRTAAPMASDTLSEIGYQAENEAAQRVASAGAEAATTIAQKAVEAGPLMAQKAAATAPTAASKAAAAAPELMRNVAEEGVRTVASKTAENAAPVAQQAAIDHVTTTIAQTGANAASSGAQTSGYGAMAHPGLWLLIGALVAVGLWLTVDYIQSKNQ